MADEDEAIMALATAEELAQADALIARVSAKIEKMLAPLEREMLIMKWDENNRLLFWNELALAAMRRVATLRATGRTH